MHWCNHTPAFDLHMNLAQRLLIRPVCLCDKGVVSAWVMCPDFEHTHITLVRESSTGPWMWRRCLLACHQLFCCVRCVLSVLPHVLVHFHQHRQTWASVWHLFCISSRPQNCFCVWVYANSVVERGYLLEERTRGRWVVLVCRHFKAAAPGWLATLLVCWLRIP